jgi:Helix-turn-helix domain
MLQKQIEAQSGFNFEVRNPRILGKHAPLGGTTMSHCYRQLRLDEREAIFRMKDARLPVGRIAEQLGRHPSTIYRELRRNFFYDEDSYFRG